ncbi:MAG: membrane protein insertase YidC [Fibrobacterota bacterium]
MNRKTIAGIALVIGIMAVLNSPFWYNMMGYQHPSETEGNETISRDVPDQSLRQEEESVQPQISDASSKDDVSETPDDGDFAPQDEESPDTEAEKEEDARPDPQTILLENSRLSLDISETGAVITQARLLEYTYRDAMPDSGVVRLLDTLKEGIGQIAIDTTSLGSRYFAYDADQSSDMKAVFTAHAGEDTITKTYELSPDSYYIDVSIESNRLQGSELSFFFQSGMNETEDPKNLGTRLVPREYNMYDASGKIHVETHKSRVSEEYSGDYRWFGTKAKYFGAALIYPENTAATIAGTSYPVNPDEPVSGNNINYSLEGRHTVSGNEQKYRLFMGPMKVDILREAGVELDKMVFRGWSFLWLDTIFPALCNFVLWVMTVIYGFFSDYGIGILGITILMKLLTFPLTQSSLKSMKQMKEVQPKIREIQKKYKKDPQVMQAKMMEFYKKEGVSPLAGLGGCLPMFIQMPIMLSLFVVPRKAIELRGQQTILAPWAADLSQPEVLFNLPFHIPLYGGHVSLLPILASLLMFLQNKDTISDPQQRSMMIMMPIFMVVMFNNFPAGLTLYFLFSTVFQLLQQKLVNKNVETAPKKA